MIGKRMDDMEWAWQYFRAAVERVRKSDEFVVGLPAQLIVKVLILMIRDDLVVAHPIVGKLIFMITAVQMIGKQADDMESW